MTWMDDEPSIARPRALKAAPPREASAARQIARQEFAAVAKPFGVDAVAEAGGQVPFHRHIERREPLRRLKQRLRWNEFVGFAVNQKHRRPRVISAATVSGLPSGGSTSSPE